MASLNELVSPFLKAKLDQPMSNFDEASIPINVIQQQYFLDSREAEISPEEKTRHYEATLPTVAPGQPPAGVERLYKRSVVILPHNICAAHCRWCIRARYGSFRLSHEDLQGAVRYCGEHPELREVLVSGGDPLMTPTELGLILDLLVEVAPNIDTVRIASRVPLQAPERINNKILDILGKRRKLRLEMALHVNHAEELFPEVTEAIYKLRQAGLRLYCQTVLLKGLNDNIKDLIKLYDDLRTNEIEPHYLFHCVPMRGMSHHRTSVEKGLTLIRELTNGGNISGRAKPRYAVMSDIGKIILHDGVIAGRRDGGLLLNSCYSYEERRTWNPDWQIPSSASVGRDGYMSVWYSDGTD
jgi:lysine 2,3-aminomutase